MSCTTRTNPLAALSDVSGADRAHAAPDPGDSRSCFLSFRPVKVVTDKLDELAASE
jgi:hypothetical protein